MNDDLEKTTIWLRSKPSLETIGAEYPQMLEAVRSKLTEISRGGSVGFSEYLRQMSQEERILEKKFRSSHGDKNVAAVLANQLIRTRIAHLVIKQHLVSEATGIESGKVRFNLLNGYCAQKLLFTDGLERKPVSMFWFRLFWPLLWQRNLLMPLVQPEGIYCFYSQELINSLADLIGSQKSLEIAAGDGTLTRFLADKGIHIIATDDQSWEHEVKYPEFVEKRDAHEALREYTPEVVICSWPPADNKFERQVFRTRSVQLYIVIGSRHRIAAGNWGEYHQQSTFDCILDENMSKLVLPPELDAAVYIFKRKLKE